MYSNICPFCEVNQKPMCYYYMMNRNQMLYRSEAYYDSSYARTDSGIPTHTSKKGFTIEEARQIAAVLGIDFTKFDVEQFRMGLDVELEHGRIDPRTNVTGDDPILTGKIALAHLNEFPDYYTRLAKMEAEGKVYWGITD
ncbi:hypothetical protein HNQ80_003328 [Anaerosolibacter carboniphilus]|uniref:Uncharacterized protein n=1 Tax=Anaerosolibacter carboniphilus TaxID=1417629 RepID=A0A841L498_9FIRM|nr:DUF5661 family protein [Anaerosolibacter carboniphilus]MBB6217209.1 hypothetical protein [Anaerosolibacter carboniphilus]